MVLGRAATPAELADEQQGHLNRDQLTLLRGIMASEEFSRLRRAWRDGRETHTDPEAVERALTALGPSDLFIRRAYETILGRSPDEGGQRHYLAALAGGERRLNIIRDILSRIPYKMAPRDKVKLPDRQKKGGYKEPDYPWKYIKERY